jgi:hypothetical protein
MLDWYKYEIIENKKSKPKILIGLGDSFTQGQGACSIELWESYDWDLGKSTEKDNFNLLKSFYENSWVNQLCKNHLTDYTPINLGMTGRGNRAAVKELYLHPELKMETTKEKIVIFMLTGMERFDFVHKELNQHIHFKTMWPSNLNDGEEGGLWKEYLNHVYSEKSAVIELLLNITEAQTWCKANNAKLILTSAFSTDYNNETFYNKIRGDKNDSKNYLYDNVLYIQMLLASIEWDNYLRPGGYSCVADYLCHLENRDDLIGVESSAKYYDYAYSSKKMSKGGYITPCAHPSIKGHSEIAKTMYDFIIKHDYLSEIKKQNKLL